MNFKKIAIRGGHNFQARGASALLDETVEDRKVYQAAMKYLRANGANVLDVTPGNCGVDEDLAYGVNKAKSWGADLFISIHFDKAYDHYEGALGTGTWVCGLGGQAEVVAKRIVNNVANGTGFKNRGVKTNPKLYELRKTTNIPAVIVETCFCEATKDAAIYRAKGPDYIGKLIAEAILNQSISSSAPVQQESQPSVSDEGFYESNEQRTNATIVGSGDIPVLNKNGDVVPNRYISSLDRVFVDGIYPSRKYIELVYPGGSKKYHAYIDIKYYSRLSFDDHMGYQNDDGITYVWWNSNDVNVADHNEELQPGQKASPMYRYNGRLRITFYREDGVPSDGYVRYEGEQSKRFYEEIYGIVKVNSYLNVRDAGGNIIGKVFNNEKVKILSEGSDKYHIEYDTSNGKKTGYVASQYVKKQ